MSPRGRSLPNLIVNDSAGPGQKQKVSAAAEIAGKRPFRIDAIHRASAASSFGRYVKDAMPANFTNLPGWGIALTGIAGKNTAFQKQLLQTTMRGHILFALK